MPPSSAAHLVGRTAVVVGGTSGIGAGIALRLGSLGLSVTVVGRDAARGEAIVASLRAANPAGAHAFAPCNAFSLRSVQACAATLRPQPAPLDVLVLSQGMATLQGFTPTAEGLDEKLSLHVWSRVAFTRALLPSLRAAPSPMVLSVLSAGVHAPYAGWEKDFELSKGYSLKGAADAAGLYNDIAMDAQAAETGNEHVLFVHAAPGFVNTAWGTEMPWAVRMLVRAIQPLGRSPADCAEAMLSPLLTRAEGREGGGCALIGAQGKPAQKTSAHEGAKAGVWAATRGVVTRVLGEEFWAAGEVLK